MARKFVAMWALWPLLQAAGCGGIVQRSGDVPGGAAGASAADSPAQSAGGQRSAGGGGPVAPANGGENDGPQLGVQLQPPNSYVTLSATDAVAGPTPAPAAWASAGCIVCHGAIGQGVSLLAPEVRHVPAAYAQYVVRHGRLFNGQQTGMVAFPTTSIDPVETAISDADLTAVITWLDQQPKPITGQGLFLDFCGNCHGKDGAGGIEPVKVTGEAIAKVNQTVRLGKGTDISKRNAYMPPEPASALSDAELTLIEQFIGAK